MGCLAAVQALSPLIRKEPHPTSMHPTQSQSSNEVTTGNVKGTVRHIFPMDAFPSVVREPST